MASNVSETVLSGIGTEDTEIELRRYLYPDLQGPGDPNNVKDEHPYDAAKENLE